MTRADQPGIGTFLLGWLGQVVSVGGSQLTGFGLGVWLYQRTGSVTIYGLTITAAAVPQIMVSPFAGVLVDRWSRRRAILLAHVGAGACSLLIAVLLHFDALQIAAVFPIVALASCFNSLQFPAFVSSSTLLVPRAHLGRANGLLQLGMAACQIIAPAATGFLLPTIGLGGILMIDVSTFIFAIVVFLFLRIPRPATTAAGREARGSMLQQLTYGFRYIQRRPGLLGLLLFLAVINFNMGMVEVLITPLVLGFADTRVLGKVASVGGIGMLVGSGLMVAWGGPRRRVHGVLGFVLLQGLLLFLGAARPTALVVALGAFGVLFTVPLIAGCSQTLWQRKIPADIQGRVFSFRTTVAGAALPLAFVLSGPLADRVFEPLMAAGGPLANSVGRILGVGPGRGVALLFVVLGCLSVASVLAGALYPPLRRVEEDLPDQEVVHAKA